jgi:hypothetical protein
LRATPLHRRNQYDAITVDANHINQSKSSENHSSDKWRRKHPPRKHSRWRRGRARNAPTSAQSIRRSPVVRTRLCLVRFILAGCACQQRSKCRHSLRR